jgi:hypothetical protein
MGDDEYTVLEGIRDLTHTDRAFFSMVRFLDGNSRNLIVAAHLRNTNLALGILRTLSTTPQTHTESIVMNFPLNTLLDPSGNFMRNFMDPVPVTPSRAQIEAATETHIGATETTCTICQEPVECATRIRACGHCFHGACINEWFTMNTRCPVCRHDIRDLRQPTTSTSNDSGVHTDEE